MRFRSCQRAITLAIALAVAAYAPVALAEDVAALLKRADAIKTSDNRTFQSILTQLDGEHASLTPQQRSYLQYLHAWQLAFSGDFAKAMPAFDAIIDSQQDATVRLRAGVTSVNLLTIASRNLEAYTRLSKVLDVLPQATDADARAQALGVASMLFSQAGQYELGLSFANKYVAADPTSQGACKGGALRVLALRQDKSVTLADQDFESTITACENIGEPIYAAITRSQAARYYLDHGRTQDAIAILQRHYEQTQATHYPAVTSEVDAVLALAEEKAGDAEQARSYAQRAASEVPKNQNTEAAADAFGVLYRDAKHRGDAVAALDWHEKFAAADKGYLSDVSARALAYQQVHQQVAARKAEIATLNQQNQLLTLKREVDAKNLLAVRLGVALLLVRVSRPHVAFLGRIPGTRIYSDLERHPDNEPLRHAILVRPEGSLIYVNAAAVLEAIRGRLRTTDAAAIRLVVCDLSASPFIDLAGSRMLHELHAELAGRGIALRIVGARSYVRDFLRADGIGDKVGGIDRSATIHDLVGEAER